MRRPPHVLSAMTYEEARERIDAGCWALLPCGSTEAHGPHLPLSTDVVISESAAGLAADALFEEGVTAVVLPPIAYTVTEFASEFAGTLSIPSETAQALVRDVVLAAVRAGFRGVVLCNAHLEPGNIEVLAGAVREVRERGALAAFPDVTRKPHALLLGDEFRSGACHAGSYETSLVMAARPFLVRDQIARDLDDNPASLSVAIREGKQRFIEAGGPRAYFGYPAQASPAEGDRLAGVLAGIFSGAVRDLRDEAETNGRAAP